MTVNRNHYWHGGICILCGCTSTSLNGQAECKGPVGMTGGGKWRFLQGPQDTPSTPSVGNVPTSSTTPRSSPVDAHEHGFNKDAHDDFMKGL